MKKSLLALAIFGAFAGTASAQSSVTIYGIVDTGIAHIDNGGDSVNQVRSGNNNSSRIGFKGVEDLGTGLKAEFVLEQGINTDDGTGDPGFNRLSFVGLNGGFGKVRLGKQNTPIKEALSKIDPFGTGGLVNAITYLGGSANGIAAIPERNPNQIIYITPDFSGFSGEIAYQFGEAAGDNSANRVWGAQLGYANGPLNVQFAYSDGNTTTAAGVDTSDLKIALLGATYDFGAVKLHGAYSQKKLESNNGGADLKVKSGLIGVTVPFGASAIRAEYINNNDDRDDRDNNVLALSYTYSLSKRTTLYATYARVDNDDLSAQGFGTSPAVVPGENTSGLAVGIQHNF
ncbi:MAG TPA: porin [Oxalicibacterium sp.]|uniref:porin n=1 Tax=Oxalicibacterium sp. TaxID=2766525 RepID=UPI002C733FEB|nr:porin [Oxalicibacterium sp.]HWU98868.1 porin [Oxalicibacterium sp.]